jgi:hypothetical protein
MTWWLYVVLVVGCVSVPPLAWALDRIEQRFLH